jgi:hypothetical protein
MKPVRSLLFVASALTLLAACSQTDEAAISPSPQYGTSLDDFATHVATNETGHLYTLGTILDYNYDEGETNYHEVVLKRFNIYGRELWSHKFGPFCDADSYIFACGASTYGLSTDSAGNSYVLEGGSEDGNGSEAALSKLSASGTLLWSRQVYVMNEESQESVMATSAAGETFIAYYYSGMEAPTGPFLTKYSASGQVLFTKPHLFDDLRDAFVAGDGSLYIVGYGSAVQGMSGGKLAKYSSAGDLLWQRDVPDVLGAQVAVGGNKVYVGTNSATRTGTNIITLYRYTPAGTRVWQRTIRPYDFAQMNGLSADASGNAYLGGYNTHNDPDNGNLFGRKYTPWGSVAWTYTPNLRGTLENALDVSAADSGKVYLVGHTNTTVNGKNHGREDAFLLRLNTAGKKVWSR